MIARLFMSTKTVRIKNLNGSNFYLSLVFFDLRASKKNYRYFDYVLYLFFQDDINVNETSNKHSENDKKQLQNESFERSASIERAYVHEVYENCEEELNSSGIRSKVAQFLTNLDSGSIICDVGCGNGRYLQSPGYNPSIFSIGVERCFRIAKLAKASAIEVIFIHGSFKIEPLRFNYICIGRHM